MSGPDEFATIAASWRPAPAVLSGVLEPGVTGRLAALLGVREPEPGEPLPPLWHEIHLRDAVSVAALGDDGHPRGGPLLPPLAERRRMFGGSAVEIRAPLRVGDVATRSSRVADVRVRTGRSGLLLLVTEEHVWSVAGSERLREHRDLIYRRAADLSTPRPPTGHSETAPPDDPETAPAGETRMADERYLFAYSALTYNLHRIHYDDRYTREVEGHPGLVVHGPLLALWCAEYARRQLGRPPTSLRYRLTSTAYVGRPVTLSSSEQAGALVVEARCEGRACARMSVS